MFTITERAKAELVKMAAKKINVPGDAFRLQPTGSFLSLVVDDVETDDVQFQHEGYTILVLDEGTSELLSKSTLDLVDNGSGQRLALRPALDVGIPMGWPKTVSKSA